MQKQNDWETRNRLSFHEGGHAVAAHALGSHVFEVSIAPSNDYDGRCVPGVPRNAIYKWRGISIDHIIVDVAGGVAERIEFDAVGLGSHSDEMNANMRARGVAREAGFHCTYLFEDEI